VNRNKHGAIVLTEYEATALANLIALRKLADVEDWHYWEDLPLLTAEGFEEVNEAIKAQADQLASTLASFEATTGVDSRQVYGEVS
jgi:hypothetical protein